MDETINPMGLWVNGEFFCVLEEYTEDYYRIPPDAARELLLAEGDKLEVGFHKREDY